MTRPKLLFLSFCPSTLVCLCKIHDFFLWNVISHKKLNSTKISFCFFREIDLKFTFFVVVTSPVTDDLMHDDEEDEPNAQQIENVTN